MPQSLAKNVIHLIFSTKNRQPLLSDDIRDELHAYIATVLKNLESPAIVINSVDDHIHLLFTLHRTVALSTTVQKIKASSSKWLKPKSPNLSEFAWQAGYGAFSVSESNIPQVKTYIENQQEHHRTKTFQDELRSILKKHNLTYDETYLWD